MLYNVYKHKNEKNFTGIRTFITGIRTAKGSYYRDTEKEVD